MSTPADIEAERAVLGSLLIQNAGYHAISGSLRSNQFFRKVHQTIYDALVNIIESGSDADFVTLRAELERRNQLDDVGGAVYLASLIDGVPRSVNIAHYASVVAEQSQRRRLMLLAKDLSAKAETGEDDSQALLQWAEGQLIDVAGRRVTSRRQTAAEAVPELMAELDRRVTHRGQITGIPTGFPSIDRMTMGWQPGDLIFIGARPSIGKTTLGVNCAIAAAKAGHRGVIFSLEMTAEQLWCRVLSELSSIPLERIRGGYLSDTEMQQTLAPALEVLNGLPLEIDDAPSRTFADVRRTCRQIQSERGLAFVLIDYVQLMRGNLDRRGATRNEELTDISNKLKVMAKDLRVPVLVLAQLGRASDKEDRRPKLSDFRECGAFEQDADIALMLHRKNHREGGVTEAIFAKTRNSKPGTLLLTLDADCVRFTDGGELPVEAEPVQKPKKAKAFRW